MAQSTVIASCIDAGLFEEPLLADECLLPPGIDQLLAIAMDDINSFEAFSRRERAQHVVPSLARLDA